MTLLPKANIERHCSTSRHSGAPFFTPYSPAPVYSLFRVGLQSVFFRFTVCLG